MTERLWLILLLAFYAPMTFPGVSAAGSWGVAGVAAGVVDSSGGGCTCCCGADSCPCVEAPEGPSSPERPVQRDRGPRMDFRTPAAPVAVVARSEPVRPALRTALTTSLKTRDGVERQAILCIWRT